MEQMVGNADSPDDKKEILCGNCNDQRNSAKVRCLDCKEFLCQSCHASHQSFKAMKHHKILTLDELQSGKVALLSGGKEDPYCREHDGEMKRFYCETCVKLVCRDCVVVMQCCRDHQYATLGEAAKKQTARLRQLLETRKVKERECEDAIRNTEEVEKDFKVAAKACREAVSSLRGEYIRMLEEIFLKHDNDVKAREVERTQKLCRIKTDLQSKLDQIQSAIDLGSKVTVTGTDFDIATNFTSLSHNLQSIIQSQPAPADESLAQMKLKIPIISFHSSKPWKHIGKFVTKSRVYSPHGVTIHQDGDIAVATSRNVNVFSRAGSLLYSFKASQNHQIVVTSDKKYIIDALDGVSCYDFKNKQKSAIHIFDDNKLEIKSISLAVDSTGHIIVASGATKGSPSWFGLVSSMIITSPHQVPKISIHQLDGSFIRSFTPEVNPRYLAVTSTQDIVITFDDDTVQMIDYSGNNIRVISPPPNITKWAPQNVCCGNTDLFIVNTGDPMAVYRYSMSGIYLGLVASLEAFQPPVSIDLTPDGLELFVVDRRAGCVQIFKA